MVITMKHRIEVEWRKRMAFQADLFGQMVTMDADPAVGGENGGARPKPLMLAALGGCTGMDVVSILAKMRVVPDDFRMIIEGDVTEEHPKQYTGMHIVYEFRGRDLPRQKLEQAVELSQQTYCGVSAVYKKALPVTYEIRVHEE